MRKKVINYLTSSPHLLDGTILSVQDYVDNNDVATYLDKMKQSGTYGDHITLTAIACLYKVIFIILSTLGIEGTRIISPLKDSQFSKKYKLFLLGHYAEHQGSHYVCLKPSSQDSIAQILTIAKGHTLSANKDKKFNSNTNSNFGYDNATQITEEPEAKIKETRDYEDDKVTIGKCNYNLA